MTIHVQFMYRLCPTDVRFMRGLCAVYVRSMYRLYAVYIWFVCGIYAVYLRFMCGLGAVHIRFMCGLCALLCVVYVRFTNVFVVYVQFISLRFKTYLLLLHFRIEEGKKCLSKLCLGAYKTLIYFLIEFVTNSVTKEVK